MNIETHPCFSSCCSNYARIHLPVAPACNMQCNYCVRKFSCANENRPGVTVKVMSPEEALLWYKDMQAQTPMLTVVGIAGPGDSLANWSQTKRTLELIRTYDRSVQFCLSTNGLLLPDYVDDLLGTGVEFVTVTVNAIDPRIGTKIYSFINDGTKILKGEEAAKLLWDRQREGIKKLVAAGICVKINSVAIPGINLEEIVNVAQTVGELGCELQNIIPMLPVAGSAFGNLSEPAKEQIQTLRMRCRKYVRQMMHCARCRADAVGSLQVICK
ncbi:MAG: radical SAM protein [Phascolarctobacterium sp.]|nr:radical SAM protein [Phascolarctobacterium sp.]